MGNDSRIPTACQESLERPGYGISVNYMNEGTQERYYQITIQGHLDPRWSEWFENMTVEHKLDGTTTLKGPVTDRASLYGILNKLRDMSLTLLSVEALSSLDKSS